MVNGQVAPAEDAQPFLSDDSLDGSDRGPTLGVIHRKERGADRVAAMLRQVEADNGSQERVRDLGEDAGAVAGVRLAALGATVLEVAQDREPAVDGAAARLAGHVGYEGDAARVVFVAAVIEPLRAGC